MAKLINILAVSLGGGLVLGAGIRALESRPRSAAPTGGEPASSPGREGPGRLLARIENLEARLSKVEPTGAQTTAGFRAAPFGAGISGTGLSGAPLSAIYARLEAREAESEVILARLAATEASVAGLNENVAGLNENRETLALELREWASSDIRRQILDAENRLAKNFDDARRESLEALVEGVQLRVSDRIAKLEHEVTGQAAAIVELRECSVKTEQSIQKLLVGIDRLVAVQTEMKPGPAPLTGGPVQDVRVPEVRKSRREIEDVSAPRRRWGLFG